MQTQRHVRATPDAGDGRTPPLSAADADALAGARPSALELRATAARARGGSLARDPGASVRAAPAARATLEDVTPRAREARDATPNVHVERATSEHAASGRVPSERVPSARVASARVASERADSERANSERAPLWFVGVLALAGGLAWADGPRGWLQARRCTDSAAIATASALDGSNAGAPRFDLASAGPRELRRLPGIGDQRALALAHARWKSGAPAVFGDLDAQPGIGPITAGRVADWLREAGLGAGLGASLDTRLEARFGTRRDTGVAPRARDTPSQPPRRAAAAAQAPSLRPAAPHGSPSRGAGAEQALGPDSPNSDSGSDSGFESGGTVPVAPSAASPTRQADGGTRPEARGPRRAP